MSSFCSFLLKSFFLFDCQRSCADLSISCALTRSAILPARSITDIPLRCFPGLGRRHCRLVGLDGLEPSTSRLSGARSSHLSYKPRLLLKGFRFVHLFASPVSPSFGSAVNCRPLLRFPGIGRRHCRLVEMKGIEPLTPCLQGRCSPS